MNRLARCISRSLGTAAATVFALGSTTMVLPGTAMAQDEALELGVIDLVARDRDELLAAANGRTVKVGGEPWVLELEGAEVRVIEMTPLTRLFNFLASPDIAEIGRAHV